LLILEPNPGLADPFWTTRCHRIPNDGAISLLTCLSEHVTTTIVRSSLAIMSCIE